MQYTGLYAFIGVITLMTGSLPAAMAVGLVVDILVF